jgi:uncharacterized cysteine cluster protein YcgN (CxxCxxCC family)
METIWVNPVVKGSCTANQCGGACCKFRVYNAGQLVSERWCEHFDQETIRCKIYEIRPDGCRRYPEVRSLLSYPVHQGCGYYLEEE